MSKIRRPGAWRSGALALSLAIPLIGAVLLGPSPAAAAQARPAPGALVVVGGGGTPAEVISHAIELAGGVDARIVVLPQASATATAGESTVRMFEEAGARRVVNRRFAGSPGTDELPGPWPTIEETAAAIRDADLIWFPGGGQGRLKRSLDDAGLTELIRERHREGTVVGGTSAGAAVMAAVMITGDGYDLEAITTGSTHVAEGLGLWPEALVDQHFLKRQRNNRLLSAVIDHPDLVGVGIDERTAVIVEPGSLRVMGESSVVVFDARAARIEEVAVGTPATARDVRIHVLRRGMTWDRSP
jgi:cyanophycinase